MDPKYEAIENKGVASSYDFLAKYGKALSPKTRNELSSFVEKKRTQNLVDYFGSLPGIRGNDVKVMPKKDFLELSAEDMADYCAAYEELHAAVTKTKGVDYSSITKDDKLYDGDRVIASSATACRGLCARVNACPQLQHPKVKLPPKQGDFAALDRRVCYDLNQVKEIGVYPSYYAFDGDLLQKKEDAIRAKEKADQLKKDARAKFFKLFLVTIMPCLLILALSAGIGMLASISFYQQFKAELNYSTAYPLGFIAIFVLASAILRIVFDVIPTPLFRDLPLYDRFKGIGLIASGVARVPMVFLLPLLYEGINYVSAVVIGVVICATGFLLQLFLQRRDHTFYLTLFLEATALCFVLAYAPLHLTSIAYSVSEEKMVLRFEPLLLIFGTMVGQYTQSVGAFAERDQFIHGRIKFGTFLPRYLFHLFYYVVVPLLLVALIAGTTYVAQHWMRLWDKVYFGNQVFTFALFGYVILDALILALFLAVACFGLYWLFRVPLKEDGFKGSQGGGVYNRVYWTVISACLVLLCLFGLNSQEDWPWITPRLPSTILALVACAPTFVFPFLFSMKTINHVPMFRFVSRPLPFAAGSLLTAATFPFVNMALANNNQFPFGMGLALVLMLAVYYGGMALLYIAVEDY